MSGWVCLPVCCSGHAAGWGTKVHYVAQLGRNFSQFLSGSCLQLHSIYRLHTRPISMISTTSTSGGRKRETVFLFPCFVSTTSVPRKVLAALLYIRGKVLLLQYYNNIYNNVHILDSRYLQFSWSLTKAWSWLRAQSSATQSIAWHN